MDVWIFSHSRFCRNHFRHAQASGLEPDQSQARFEHTTPTGRGGTESATSSAAAAVEENAATSMNGAVVASEPGEAVNVSTAGGRGSSAEHKHGSGRRRSSVMKGLRWAFWYNGNE